MRYIVTIRETLEKKVIVDSDNADQALEEVRQNYGNCEIVLDSEDFTGEVDFSVEPELL